MPQVAQVSHNALSEDTRVRQRLLESSAVITHVAAGCKISLFALDSASNIAAPLQRMPQNRAVVDAERGRSLAVQKKRKAVQMHK